MTKYLLCDSATADYGKSTTLNYLLDLFKSMPELYKIISLQEYNAEGDNVCVIQCVHSNKTIIIQTGGDNEEAFKLTLDYLAYHEPDIIVCASRTKQSTAEATKYICDTYEYHYIDFRNLCAWQSADIPFVKQLNKHFLVPAIYETILHLL